MSATEKDKKDLPHRVIIFNGKPYDCLCDTGACRTVLTSAPPGYRTSGKVETQQHTKLLILVDPNCPINLLGRDLMTQLKIAVVPTADGMATAVLTDQQVVEDVSLPHYYWTLDLSDRTIGDPGKLPTEKAHALNSRRTEETQYQSVKDMHVTFWYKHSPGPRQAQYKLSPEAEKGIQSVIEDMKAAGIIRPVRPTEDVCNTPIFPVKKASGNWRMVQDLRAVNNAIQHDTPEVENPHTLMNSITSNKQYFSVVDLSNAFFSVPLHEDSQHWFGFTHKDKKYTYTRLPQEFSESPHQFLRALEYSMNTCKVEDHSQVLLYVDDIIIASDTAQHCKDTTIQVLQHLYSTGHKVSLKKLMMLPPPLPGFLHTYRLELTPKSSILVSSDQRILFLIVWESFMCFLANSMWAFICLALRRGFRRATLP
uniref:ribonuclease H n=1 Tax=Amphiprion percula TaxID=161767 RepID=A0A3P8RS76_AMPPE